MEINCTWLTGNKPVQTSRHESIGKKLVELNEKKKKKEQLHLVNDRFFFTE